MDKFFFEYLLRLGDTTLVLSQRLSEWCGHGPALEEDLALTNTELDLLAPARMWLTLAGVVDGADRVVDALANFRHAPEFCNVTSSARPKSNNENTLPRH